MTTKKELGRFGEQVAAEYLECAGFRVIEKNWRCPLGEVDIVALDGDDDDDDLVIVEVKTRRGLGAGHPFEAVTPDKLARLRRLAGEWARVHPATARCLRVDVVGITVWPDGTESVQHLEGVS
jgi:putative endonuclease